MRVRRMLILTAAIAVMAAIVVPVALAIRFTDDSYNMPIGVVGQPYYKQFDGAGGCGPGLPYQYRILNGSLPPGLSMTSSGLISGTPTVAGDWSFWVELSDQDPPSASWCVIPAKTQRDFVIHVVAGLSVSTPSTPPGTVGVAYNLGLTASGGGSQTWSVAAGSLPAGLTLASNGVLSGTPTTAGTFTFTAKVTDGSRSSTKQFTLSVRDPLAVQTPTVPKAEVGVPFEALKLAVTGGSGTNTWNLEGTLPAGLAFDAQNVAITGTPTGAGSFPVKVTVTDSEGRTTAVNLTLVVASKLTISTTRIAPTKVGKLYRATLKTVGGVGPLAWRVVPGSGRFPVGIHLDRVAGAITGSARTAGTFTFTVEAKDSLGVTYTQKLVLTVKKKAAGY